MRQSQRMARLVDQRRVQGLAGRHLLVVDKDHSPPELVRRRVLTVPLVGLRERFIFLLSDTRWLWLIRFYFLKVFDENYQDVSARFLNIEWLVEPKHLTQVGSV